MEPFLAPSPSASPHHTHTHTHTHTHFKRSGMVPYLKNNSAGPDKWTDNRKLKVV